MGNIQYRPPFTTVSNVNASRAVDTLYTNTSGKVMLVLVSFQCTTGATGTSNAYAGLQVDGATVTRAGLESGLANENNTYSLVAAVPPGSTYKLLTVVTGTGAVAKNGWIEVI